MRIGSYDPRGFTRCEVKAARPATGRSMKDARAAAGPDDVNLSAAARKLAAAGGADRVEKPTGENNRPGRTERAETRKDSGHYDRPEVKEEIARRIADEILKNSSAEKGSGKQDDNNDDSNR